MEHCAPHTRAVHTARCLEFHKTDLDFWSHSGDGKILQFSRRNMVLVILTLLHSERPKLYGVLAVLSAVGLTCHGYEQSCLFLAL